MTQSENKGQNLQGHPPLDDGRPMGQASGGQSGGERQDERRQGGDRRQSSGSTAQGQQQQGRPAGATQGTSPNQQSGGSKS